MEEMKDTNALGHCACQEKADPADLGKHQYYFCSDHLQQQFLMHNISYDEWFEAHYCHKPVMRFPQG
jgi:YHS domain-containing protein